MKDAPKNKKKPVASFKERGRLYLPLPFELRLLVRLQGHLVQRAKAGRDALLFRAVARRRLVGDDQLKMPERGVGG